MNTIIFKNNVKAYPQWGIKCTNDEIRTEL